jgi:hypothetical protein
MNANFYDFNITDNISPPRDNTLIVGYFPCEKNIFLEKYQVEACRWNNKKKAWQIEYEKEYFDADPIAWIEFEKFKKVYENEN